MCMHMLPMYFVYPHLRLAKVKFPSSKWKVSVNVCYPWFLIGWGYPRLVTKTLFYIQSPLLVTNYTTEILLVMTQNMDIDKYGDVLALHAAGILLYSLVIINSSIIIYCLLYYFKIRAITKCSKFILNIKTAWTCYNFFPFQQACTIGSYAWSGTHNNSTVLGPSLY